jgi:hypothetical protein
MLGWLATLEHTAFSVWLRESPSLWAFPFVLYLHTLGLALLAGLSVGIDIWVLAGKPWPKSLSAVGLHQVMWLGFGINALSGVALLLAYPAKALTNWVFFAKLLLIALAIVVIEQLRKEVFTPTTAGLLGVSTRARYLAITSLCLWTGAILAGRLLAYTYTILLASEPTF